MPVPTRLRPRLALAGALLLCLLASPPATLSATPSESPALLPDLRMRVPDEFHVRRTHDAQPRRLLRFTTSFVNVGEGPFEVRGRRDCTSLSTCPRMLVRQRTRLADGTSQMHETTARMKLEVGDGHHHWHVIGMERFELYDLSQPGGGVPLRGAKFGYCFFDVRPFRLSLPGAPGGRRYAASGPLPNNGCGGGSDLTTRMGLSVGWQDIYPWDFAGQFIDITGVADGDYLLCVTADPKDRFTELDEDNNQAWTRLRITDGGVDVMRSRRKPCADRLPPVEEPAP